jgi:putative hemolysin
MNGTDWTMLAVILGILVVLVFLALAEMSLSRLTVPRAQAISTRGTRSAKALVRLAENPTQWINPLLLTVNVLQTVQATLTGILSDRLFGPVGVAIGVSANVVVFFVLAEAVPKTYAVLHPTRGATLTARSIDVLVRFWPLRLASRVLIGLTNVIVPGKGLKEGPFASEQEFLGIIEAAAQESVIEEEEEELIKSVIEFGDTTVREIMVPRLDLVTVDEDRTVTEALDRAVGEGFSRLPVMRKDDSDVDDVVGVVYVKDLLRAERDGRGAEPVSGMMRPIEVVPESKMVGDLMRSMQSKKFHVVMVADEYGTITGLATLEDCIEELVGEIEDEHDEDVSEILQVSEDEWIVLGVAPIDNVNEETGMSLTDADFDSVGGYVFGALGHVPGVGDRIEVDGYVLTVLSVDGRRIDRLRIRRRADQPEALSSN